MNDTFESTTKRSEAEISDWIAARVAGELNIAPDEVDRNGDLTNCGLDSIAAFTLTGDLAEWLDRDLRATLLWEFPSIQSLAQHLAHETETESDFDLRSLVTLQANGKRAPLFCIDGAVRYRALACNLASDQPVYGLIPEDATEGQWYSFDKIGARVRHYAEIIKKVQPHGPYYIAGLSFAGVVAFMVAQELRRRGEEVALLALFDTSGPGYFMLPISERFSLHWRAWKQMDGRARTKYIAERARNRLKLQPKSAALEAAAPEDYIAPRSQEEWEDEWQIDNLARRLSPAEKTYLKRMMDLVRRRPRTAHYDGKTVIFVAQDEPMGFMEADTSRGWRDFIPNLQVHSVAGTHTTMIQEPLVMDVARLLDERLRETQNSSIEVSR